MPIRHRRAPEQAPRPGATIGRYRVRSVLSSWPGVASVVDAQAPEGAAVTLTVLDELAGDGPRDRIAKAAAARAALQHPHLLPARAGTDGAVLATAAKGRLTLADLLREGPLEPRRALRILGQVAAALEVAAAKGLVHRDLTPAAIALRGRGPDHAYLGDFAIARPAARACTDLAGVDHRSPEELRGEGPRPRSNVYSLTCILVECLTGEPPYPQPRPLLTVHAHLVAPPPRLSERRDAVPELLDDVIALGLAKDPRERHRSPAQLVLAAARALDVDVRVPVAADVARQRARERVAVRERRRARRRPEERGPARRSRWAVALAGGLLALSAAGGFATGSADWSGGEPAGSAARLSAPVPMMPTAAQTRYVVAVDRVFRRLSDRRATLRRRLGAADKASGQAAAAASLGRAYATARKALPEAPGRELAALRLGAGLAAAERGYRNLSVAARQGDDAPWDRARRRASRADARVNSALGDLRSHYEQLHR